MTHTSFSIKRRAALKAMGLGAAASALSAPLAAQEATSLFQHGVASGDPLSDRVILWTRVTPPPGQTAPISVAWEVVEASNIGTVVASGTVLAGPARDFTAKVDVTGLKQDMRYRYRFLVGGDVSPLGSTRTLPVGDVEEMTIGVCSCANYPYGFFNVYKEMARNPDIDLVLHLGDYIYEYGRSDYASADIEAAGRTVLPETETVTLADYRQRYALYRTDRDLQAVHAAHPFILIWDDHEITNDGWTGGAQNHQSDTEGTWEARRTAALKAYDEWMPTRADMRRPWRSFDLGNLARIIMLDTRVWGRDKQFSYGADLEPRTIPFDTTDPADPKPIRTPNAKATAAAKKIERLPIAFDISEDPPKPVLDYQTLSTFDPETAPSYLSYLPDLGLFKEQLESPSRTLLGQEQEAWLGPQIDGSKKRGQVWQILGQQVLMGRINIPEQIEALAGAQTGWRARQIQQLALLAPYKLPLNMDAWDGYPSARARVFQQVRDYGRNLVVLAGDTHNAWVSELGDAKGKLGHEFATASVSSPGFEEFAAASPSDVEDAFLASSPQLKWVDAQHRGYLTMRYTRQQVDAKFHRVSTVASRSYSMLPVQSFVLQAGGAPGEAELEDIG